MDLESVSPNRRCRLIGSLDQEAAAEVRRQLAGGGRPDVLDVEELVHVDESGLALLSELHFKGCTIKGLNPYFALRLEDFESRDEPMKRRSEGNTGAGA